MVEKRFHLSEEETRKAEAAKRKLGLTDRQIYMRGLGLEAIDRVIGRPTKTEPKKTKPKPEKPKNKPIPPKQTENEGRLRERCPNCLQERTNPEDRVCPDCLLPWKLLKA